MNGVALLAALTFALVAPPPALSEQWVHFQAWRPIDTSPAAQPGLVRFALPVAMYGSTQPDLGDIRVIDDTGREVPFVIDSAQPRPIETWNEATLSDAGFIPGQDTQVVADVGATRVLHNTLRLAVPESESDFFVWVGVDASDDRNTWRVVRERAPIFRFRADGLAGQQQVAFPETSSRWLRIRVLDSQHRFPVDGVSVSREVPVTTERQTLPAPVTLNPRSPERKSWLDADLGVKDVPVTSVSFTAAQPEFHRPVAVSVSDDGAAWTEVAQADIYRERGSEQLSVDVPEGRGRYWRVTIYNRNDAPIDGLQARLLTTPRYVVFRQEPGRSYFVLYGNSRATAPVYDFASLTTREQRDAAPVVRTGAESSNAAYQSPEPWTERNGWVLWVALLAAVVIIGGLAIRMMRTPPAPQ
jgi:hypothetical protein